MKLKDKPHDLESFATFIPAQHFNNVVGGIIEGKKNMQLAVKELEEKARAAKAASKKLAFLSTETKNKALLNVSEALIDKQEEILAALLT